MILQQLELEGYAESS